MPSISAALHYCLLLSLGGYCNFALAQQYIYEFDHLGIAEGLRSETYNYYVHQDEEGWVWISSTAGLHRYDGQRIKHYAPQLNDPNALHSGYASMSPFYDTPDGSLWFTESSALVRYNRFTDNFERYQINEPGDSIPITSGYAWCYVDTLLKRAWFSAGKDYLFTCDLQQPDQARLVKPFSVSIESEMYRTTKGQARLLSFSSGHFSVCTFTGKGELLHDTIISSPNGRHIYELLSINDSLIWLGTNMGLYRYNLQNNQWQEQPLNWQGSPLRKIKEIAARRNGELLLGTAAQGLYFFDPVEQRITGQVQQYIEGTIRPFMPTEEYNLKIDRDDNLWISVNNKGVYFTNLNKPKFERSGSGLGTIYAVNEDAFGKLLVVTVDGMHQMTGDSIKYYPFPANENSINRPQFCYLDRQQNIWVGTLSDLLVLEAGSQRFRSFSSLPRDKSGRSSGYTSMCQLPNDDYLIGASFGDVIRLSADWQSSSRLVTGDQLSPIVCFVNPFVFSYTYGNDEQLRIYHYDTGLLRPDTVFNTIPDVHTVLRNDQGEYWLAASNGLYQLKRTVDGGWLLNTNSTLAEQGAINSMLLAPSGNLWLGTAQGIKRYDSANNNLTNYDVSDGLQSLQFTKRAALATRDGRFVFGGSQGINIFRPENIRSEIPLARPIIRKIRINYTDTLLAQCSKNGGNNAAYVKELQLKHDQNNLEFELAALTYSQPQNCQFSYRLIGANNTQKTRLERGNVLSLLNLNTGKYTLQIWATNADGIESDTYHELKIEIHPPWYRTIWFFLLLTVILSSGLYSFYRYRLRLLTLRKNAEIEAANAKAQAARAAAQKAQSEMAVMRLQMNPHFVFNSLNSIDAYILKEAPMEAHDFLIRFADLMRRILDQSEEQLSTIEEEVDFLQEYLAIEQERFGQRMNFTIYVAPALNTQTTKLPTMVLQPFIENAIVHGISGKQGEGHIQINFLAGEDDQLLIEVKDNGVGRQLKDTPSGHASKATLITQRRLAVLADSLQLATVPHFEIIDEKDDTGNPAGTTVRFFFPQKC